MAENKSKRRQGIEVLESKANFHFFLWAPAGRYISGGNREVNFEHHNTSTENNGWKLPKDNGDEDGEGRDNLRRLEKGLGCKSGI